MPGETSQIKPCKPRRWAFSLRGLTLIVMLLGGTLGWLSHEARVQREAVAAIRKAGGDVSYDWQMPTPMGPPKGKPPGPRWLVERLGVDYFSSVESVGLRSVRGTTAEPDDVMLHVGRLHTLRRLVVFESFTDVGFARLCGLTRLRSLAIFGRGDTIQDASALAGMRDLESLDLRGVEVGDDALEHIGRMQQLRELSLWGTRITDAGCVCLRGLTNLRALDLTNAQITTSGITHLAGNRWMYRLNLCDCRITDLAPIRGLRELRELYLARNPIDDAGAAPLAGFTKLEGLDLSETRIDGAGLAPLRHLDALRELQLSETMVDDSGLEHLAGLSKIEKLNLWDTPVTDVGLANFRPSFSRSAISHHHLSH